MTKEDKPGAADEKERYGRQWEEKDRQRRQDEKEQRSEPDYGGEFGL